MRVLKQIFDSNWTLLAFCGVMFYCFFTMSDRYYGWTNPSKKQSNMVRADGAGYYAYLPKWFIYGDANYEFIDSIEKAYPNDGFEDQFTRTEGPVPKRLNKYFCGTAVMCSPFYGIGHLHANLAGEKTDGYSWPYILWVNIASVFYAILGFVGIFCIGKLWNMRKFGTYLAITAVGLGTNLFYYGAIEIPYSHVFCFAINTWSIYFFLKWKNTGVLKWQLLLFAAIGLAIIVRPTNVLILSFFPFLFESSIDFFQWFKKHIVARWKIILLGVLIVCGILFIQIYNNYTQLGSWKLNAYENEGFSNWKNPFFWEVLFGFNKGMFIYSPILLLMIPGVYFMFKENKYRAFGFLFSFTLIVYIISSWWCWWYGGSLGMRALVDFFPLFIIPIMVLFNKIKPWVYILVLPLVYGGIVIHQIFESQYKQYIIRYDHMDYKEFCYVFMKQEPRHNFILFRNIDTLSSQFTPISSINALVLPDQHREKNSFECKKFTGYNLPETVIRFDSMNRSDQFFAYKFLGSVKVGMESDYLSLRTLFYKNGHLLEELDHPYSHLPDKIQTWEDVDVDVKSKWKISELDSVQIRLFFLSHTASVKLKKIVWGVE